MADVNALFANRKKKKGAKKKPTNFNAVLEDYMAVQHDEQVVVNIDSDGEEIVETVPATVGGLTAAVNAMKLKEAEEAKADKSVLKPAASSALLNGEWVDNDSSTPQASRLLSNGGPVKVLELESTDNTNTDSLDSSEQAESNKKLFHWTRKQAIQHQQSSTEVVEPEKEAPKVYRPRELLAAKSKESGEAALKQLNNDEVFPTLGGRTVSSTTKGVWGTVQEDIIEDLSEKAAGEYLGSDFIAASTFEGAKPGYSFKDGESGLGYYWEVKEIKQPVIKQSVEEAPVEPVVPEPAPAPVVEAPKELSPEEIAKLEKEREEKERKRQEKKKEKQEWERQQALLKQKEEEELKKKVNADSSQTQSSTLASEPAPPPDRFAGLKKKKKKAAKE